MSRKGEGGRGRGGAGLKGIFQGKKKKKKSRLEKWAAWGEKNAGEQKAGDKAAGKKVSPVLKVGRGKKVKQKR